MSVFFAFTVIGIVTGSVYAVAASGLVVTYATSGIFNIAHGGIGMFMAFAFWELHVHRHWPTAIALPIVLFVFAPLAGALIERFLMRGLRDASVATSLVVTVGLMVSLIGLAQSIWSPQDPREMPAFFGINAGFNLGSVFITWHDALTILAAVAVAVGLWLFLTRTRTGIAMRAVVDDRNLLALNGARPARVSMLSWAIGASLASLSGILLAPALQMSVLLLTLLVVNAYAAAMVGKLKSLPLTFAGAMALGLIEAYAVGYLNPGGWLLGLRPSLPTLFLFVMLLLMPQARLRAGRLAGASMPPAISLRRSIRAGSILVIIAIAVSLLFSDANLSRLGEGLALGLIMLSLVLLTGYGGQVSLCQMSFAGLGAFAMARAGAHGSILGLVAAMALAGIAGAIMSLPSLRLQGLYLALATMAFAVFMDNIIFAQAGVFGNFGSLSIARLSIFGLSFSSEKMYFVLLAIAFAAVGVLVLAIRRGPFGRLLAAMRDSQVGCATLGLSLARTKLAVFALSAALAGLGGALYGGLHTVAGPFDFQMLKSLPILLLAVVGGINSVSGALIGGMSFALLNLLPGNVSGLIYLLSGAAGVLLGRNPNGIAGIFATLPALERIRRRRDPAPPPLAQEEVPPLAAAAG